LLGRESIRGDNLVNGGAARNRWAVWSLWRQMIATVRGWSLTGDAGLRGEGFGESKTLLPRFELSFARTREWHSGINIAW